LSVENVHDTWTYDTRVGYPHRMHAQNTRTGYTMKQSRLERFAYTYGRLKGLVQSGAKSADAPITAETAWIHPTMWGPGMGTSKPRGKEQFVQQFTSWVYICAKLNAQSVASVPIRLFVASQTKGKKFKTITTRPVERKQMNFLRHNQGFQRFIRKSEDVEEVTSHPILDLLQSVNPFMNSRDLWELTSIFCDLTGEAYWYLIRDKRRFGLPSAIWCIPSQYVTPIPGETLDDFIQGYKFERGRTKLTLPREDVIYFQYHNPRNPIAGMGCVQGIVDAVYINAQMYEYEESVFKNKARIGSIIETSEAISTPELDRLREDFHQKYGGVQKSGENLILPPGLKVVKDSMTPEELAFIEGKQITRQEICAGLDTPIALFDPTANRANYESALYFYARNGVMPRCVRFQEKLNERLCPMYDDKIFLAFDNIVPEDQELKLKMDTAYVQAGIEAINEIRGELGLDAKPGGDELYIDNRMMPLSMASQPRPETQPKPPPKPEETEEEAAKLAELVRAKLRGMLG